MVSAASSPPERQTEGAVLANVVLDVRDAGWTFARCPLRRERPIDLTVVLEPVLES
jgi:hypothetical protein